MLKSDAQKLSALLRTTFDSGTVPVTAIAKACGISSAAVYQWFKTGRVSKRNLTIFAGLMKVPLSLFMPEGGLISVESIKATEVDDVLLPPDAIEVAKSWMVLPENERNDFRRKIEAAAARYRDTVPAVPKSRRPKKGGLQ